MAEMSLKQSRAVKSSFAGCSELLSYRVAELGCVEVFVELDDEIAGDFEREGLCDLHGGFLPAALRVRTKGLTVHVGDLAVAEVVEVAQRELCCSVVIENNVGDSGDMGVAADRDRWVCGERSLEVGVDGEDCRRRRAPEGYGGTRRRGLFGGDGAR